MVVLCFRNEKKREIDKLLVNTEKKTYSRKLVEMKMSWQNK